MRTPLHEFRRWAGLLALVAALAASRLAAMEVLLPGVNAPTIDIHGFVSQGYIVSSDYNYLGDSSSGSFKFFESGLNASVNPFAHTRVAAQVFAYDVGPAGGYDLVLDYATVEYTFNDQFGIRAGRIRRPEGIYNDNQDLDVGRTWVLLPQGMYNARWRDFYLALDGADLFGTLPLGRAGSLNYDLYGGRQHPKLNGGLALQKANLPPFAKLVSFNTPFMYGGQLWWNTPVTGLRAGFAMNLDQDLTFRTVAGRQSKGSPLTQHYSLEYLRGPWTFQAEYLRFKINYAITGAGPSIVKLNIEHIKDIVSMQQSFAKNSGFIEKVSLVDLVEDALRINMSSLGRHDVELVREFEAAPVISTDKHKIVQILVNLVRNAKFACDESGRSDKRITVRIATGADAVEIFVSDNGVGIPAENLTRIFNHGFTTRKTGHGFGLHSGALAAGEVGGSLAAQSAGPGQGATFILTLPLAPVATTAQL